MQSPHHLYINISMGAWHNYLQTVAVSPRRLCLLICLLAGGRCCRTMQNCHCPTQSANDHSNVSHYHRPHLDCCCSHHITLARRFQTISAAFIRWKLCHGLQRSLARAVDGFHLLFRHPFNPLLHRSFISHRRQLRLGRVSHLETSDSQF